MYMQIAEATDDDLSKKVLKSISEEELVHAGEFLTLLKKLNPEEEGFYEKGKKEVNKEESGDKKDEEKDPEDKKKERLKDLFQ